MCTIINIKHKSANNLAHFNEAPKRSSRLKSKVRFVTLPALVGQITETIFQIVIQAPKFA